MSPEQAELTNQDIDTRSDIYSLGILLYELLTGTTPLNRERLKQAGFMEVLRLVREEEPPKPSTRLSSSRESLASISAQRHSEPARLMKQVRGDLDWIVMKALDKDRALRYETANSLARDVERFLHDEAVEAYPPSARYRLRKFARRNRRGLATAAAIVLLLVAGAAAIAWQAVRATRAENTAKQDRDKAVTAEVKATEEGEKARRSEAEAKAVLKFFQDNVLGAPRWVGPKGLGRNATVRQAIDAAEPKIAEAFQGQPLIEAAVRDAVAETYYQLGDYPLAVKQRERSLALRIDKLGADHPETLHSQGTLAMACLQTDQVERGTRLLEQLLAARRAQLGPQHPDTAGARNTLAYAYMNAKRWEPAIEFLEETLAGQLAKADADPRETAFKQRSLALAYLGTGQIMRATAILENSVELMAVKHGPDHRDTVIMRGELGRAYQADDDFARAIPLLEQGLAQMAGAAGADHPGSLRYQHNLACAYRDSGQVGRAIQLFEKTLAAQKVKPGPDDADTLATQATLGNLYEKQHEYAKAEPLLRNFVEAQKRLKGSNSKDVAGWLATLGGNLLEQQKWKEAEPVLRECLTIREAQLPDDWARFYTQSLLGECLLGEKKYTEAEPLLVAGYQGMNQLGAKSPEKHEVRLTEALGRLVQLYEAWGKQEEAARWKEELKRIEKR